MIVMDEQLLTVEEVAKKLRRNPYTVRRLLRDGKLPGYKPEGGTWLIKASDVEKYMETQKYQKPEETK